jgi:hypothetical protein
MRVVSLTLVFLCAVVASALAEDIPLGEPAPGYAANCSQHVGCAAPAASCGGERSVLVRRGRPLAAVGRGALRVITAPARVIANGVDRRQSRRAAGRGVLPIFDGSGLFNRQGPIRRWIFAPQHRGGGYGSCGSGGCG